MQRIPRPSLIAAIAVLALVQLQAGTAIAAPSNAPAGNEAQVRELLGLPANAPLRYLTEDGVALSFREFSRRVVTTPFDVTKEASGITTLQLLENGGKREIGAVTRLPPIDLPNLNGVRVRNKDLIGRPTLINFFFSTCVPCIKEAPALNAFARRHREFNYLAITPDPEDEARRFVRQRNFEWPIVANARAYQTEAQVQGFPTYLLVAADGRIIGRGTGLGAEAMKDSAAGLKELESWVAARLK